MMGELMSLQRLAGNRAVTTLIQRSSAEPEANEFAAQLGTEGELEGAAATSLDIQRKTSPGVTTEVTGTGDDIDRFDMPAAEIAAQHGRPGVVGWTTPAFNISFAGSSPQAIHATTNMRFTMQLAEEYQGSRGRILRDHEQGHTRIGMRRARRHFDEQLHDGIAALPRPFSVDAVRGVQDTAVADFRAGERADSQAYDDRDYPRMERAYHGARASMATLGHDAPVLQRLIDSLRHFKAVPVADIGPAADLVSTRIRACSRHQLETVQYNLEFSGAADAAIQRADHLRGDSTVPETARPNLEAALTLMGSLRHSTSRTVSDVLGDTTH